MNRVDNNANARILNGQGRVTVVADNGTAWAGPLALNANFVQTVQFLPYTAPVLPDAAAADQTAPMSRQSRPRYVRIVATAGINLAIREVLVLDNTFKNVAFRSTVSSTGLLLSGAASHIVDGVFDYDSSTDASTSKLSLNTTFGGIAASVTIDLGALFNLSAICIFWDRYATPAVSMTMRARAKSWCTTLADCSLLLNRTWTTSRPD